MEEGGGTAGEGSGDAPQDTIPAAEAPVTARQEEAIVNASSEERGTSEQARPSEGHVSGGWNGTQGASNPVFDQLDQITPIVTSQLQTFCSLAVNQLKIYPSLVDKLQENLKDVANNVEQLASKVSGLETHGVTHKEENTKLQVKFDERLRKIESVVAAIPAWKEAQVSAINDAKQQCTESCNELLEKMTELETLMRESESHNAGRLDTLEDLAATNTELRDKLGERLDVVASDIEKVDLKLDEKFREMKQSFAEHEVRLDLVDQRLHDTKIQIKSLQVGLEGLEARHDPLESSMQLLRVDLATVERELTGTCQQINALEVSAENLKAEAKDMGDRLQEVENDERIPHIMEVEERLDDFQNGVEDSMTDFDSRLVDALTQVTEIGVRVDSGHPELWKVQEKVEASLKQLASNTKEVATLSRDIEVMQESVGEAVSEVGEKNQIVEELQDAQRRLESNLASETKKLSKYIDDLAAPMARKHEVESVRSRLEEVKVELIKDIEESQNTVKFDLLHDPSPQVDNLKSYLKQQENGLSRLKERVVVVEESMRVQGDRMQQAELQLSETEGKIRSSHLEQLDEFPRIKQHIQKLSHTVTSLGDQFQVVRKARGSMESGDMQMSARSPHTRLNPPPRGGPNSTRSSVLFNSPHTPFSSEDKNWPAKQPPLSKEPSREIDRFQNDSPPPMRDANLPMESPASTNRSNGPPPPRPELTVEIPSVVPSVQRPVDKQLLEGGESAKSGVNGTPRMTVVERVVEKGSLCHPHLQEMVLNLVYFLHHQFLEARHPGGHHKSEAHLPHIASFKMDEEEVGRILEEYGTDSVTHNLIVCVVLLHFRLQDKFSGISKHVRNMVSHMRKMETANGAPQHNPPDGDTHKEAISLMVGMQEEALHPGINSPMGLPPAQHLQRGKTPTAAKKPTLPTGVHHSQSISAGKTSPPPGLRKPNNGDSPGSEAFIPISMMPPYNFHNKQRDIMHEQERVLALIESTSLERRPGSPGQLPPPR